MSQPVSKPIKLIPKQFSNLVSGYRERLENDSKTRAMFAGLCGSLERAQMFTKSKGVGITQFAKMMNVSTTTVRHYLRLGLVTPYEVNGKFRFKPHNLVQFESVRQWQELGLTLEEIVQLRLDNHLNQSVVRPDARKTVTTIRHLNDEEYQKLQAVVGEDIPFKKITLDQLGQAGIKVEGSSPHQYLLAEYQALREKLEARIAKIEQQIARLTQLEAALSEVKG